jgi:hypothetical protein
MTKGQERWLKKLGKFEAYNQQLRKAVYVNLENGRWRIGRGWSTT